MFSDLLIQWYKEYHRPLPWRETTDPYKIWLSEIILQQTRVDQGMSYYLKFIEHYPTVLDLANASEQEVLNDWQGLGYYSRARNLHATAKYIANELNGVFPSTYNDIIQLKGVGPYTAAAIASFAFSEVKALVDGNVYRVLARYYDMDLPIDSTQGKKEFQRLADELIPNNQPALFNQAIMEFGALQCVPNQPNCNNCPLSNNCLSLLNQTMNQRPVKSKKTRVRKRYFYYAVFQEKDEIIIQKRTEKDIWQHLYEFPLFESDLPLTEQQLAQKWDNLFGIQPYFISKEVKHVLSHQHIHARFAQFNQIPQQFQDKMINTSQLDHFPFPRLIEKFLENLW